MSKKKWLIDCNNIYDTVMSFYQEENTYNEEIMHDITNIIDMDALNSYQNVTITHDDGTTSIWCQSKEEILDTKVIYTRHGLDRYITYKEIINQLPLIDFYRLLSWIDDRSLTEKFVRIFMLHKTYCKEFSEKLRFGIHDKLIEAFADDINWEVLLRKNLPLKNEDIKKYYGYFHTNVAFFQNEDQTFDSDLLKFIINQDIENYKPDDMNYVFLITRKITTILKHHDLSQNDLHTIMKTVINDRKLNRHGRKYIKEVLFSNILEFQNVDETFLLTYKTLFKKNVEDASQYANYSEDFIRDEEAKENSIIKWNKLSHNKNLLCGKYSDDFYETYHEKINWSVFDYATLKDFNEDDKPRFKEFLFKFNKYMSPNSVISFLESSFNQTLLTVKELNKHFNDILKNVNKIDYRWAGERYLTAVYKSGNSNFKFSEWIKESNRISEPTILLLKNEIFTDMLNGKLPPRLLKQDKHEMICKAIDDKTILSFKKEIFTKMLDGTDLEEYLGTEMFKRVNKVLDENRKGE